MIVADYVGNGEFHDTGYNLSYDPVSGASPGKVKIETVNYYDSYDFLEGGKADSFVDVDDFTGVSQVGCLTGSLVLCSNGEYLSQVMEYDLKGNLLKTRSREIGGRKVTSTSTYTFTNNVASSEYDVEVKSEDHLSVKENFIYNGYNNKKESSIRNCSGW